MGFDISGLNPDNEKGEYFRNNCWWWRRLADFILDHVEMPDEEKKYWQSNDGQKVSKETAIKIYEFIKEAEKNKAKYQKWIDDNLKKYEENYKNNYESLVNFYRPFSWENVHAFGQFCKHSGGFEIY